MSELSKKPAELRSMFGSNLRHLAKDYPSISELSRQLGINRTQFNRYLAGESFPRPDVLARICDFFKIDARVLLEPVQTLRPFGDPMAGGFLNEFLGIGAHDLPEETFPTGFYKFSRRSFIEQSKFVQGLVQVTREGPTTYIRGYEAREALASQGLPPSLRAREFRGMVSQQEEGVVAFISRRGSLTCSFNYLDRVSSFENNFWVGYVTRTTRETPSGQRATRLVYEYLGTGLRAGLPVGRETGYCAFDDLPPFHQRLLQPDDPFR